MTDASSKNLWSITRRPRGESSGTPTGEQDSDPQGVRSVFQQDYDRLLFSTPVRRLADKTQVWPMDEHDGVRMRLTHSHEVSNLARSIGTRAYKRASSVFEPADLHGVVQPILSAIGLAHDLGNPPFGHQGEKATSSTSFVSLHFCSSRRSQSYIKGAANSAQQEITGLYCSVGTKLRLGYPPTYMKSQPQI